MSALPLPPQLTARMLALRAGGASFDLIAATLNQNGEPGLKGGRWFAATVRRALLRAGTAPPPPTMNNV